jgi:hypothetical protein
MAPNASTRGWINLPYQPRHADDTLLLRADAHRTSHHALPSITPIPPPLHTAPKPAVRVGGYQLRASSLLVFQSVLKGAVGEAFLATLAATQKYQVRPNRSIQSNAWSIQHLLSVPVYCMFDR